MFLFSVCSGQYWSVYFHLKALLTKVLLRPLRSMTPSPIWITVSGVCTEPVRSQMRQCSSFHLVAGDGLYFTSLWQQHSLCSIWNGAPSHTDEAPSESSTIAQNWFFNQVLINITWSFMRLKFNVSLNYRICCTGNYVLWRNVITWQNSALHYK